MSVPTVPELPVLPDEASMLSRHFGREVANYFSGSPLNRVSFLRSDQSFLRAAWAHPSAGFVLMNNLSPMVQQDKSRLAFAKRTDIEKLTGLNPFEKTEEECIKGFNSDEANPVIVFLGIDDRHVMPSSGSNTDCFEYKIYKGTPYFAVDVTPKGSGVEAANAVISAMNERGLSFEASSRNMTLLASEAAMYAQARALLDWNARNPFCAQCGQATLSVNAGTKRVCPPTDAAGGTVSGRKPCATRGTVSNLSFARTDPTVITAVVNADWTKVLLGRQRRWPKNLYSALAGFLEPGESIEEAVRREVWEESGVRVGRVVLHSSQPWPFPANLMIGAVAQALSGDGETIFLGNDPELEDAQWFPMDTVKLALAKGSGPMHDAGPEGYPEGALRLPPAIAIANRLITAVAEGWGFPANI